MTKLVSVNEECPNGTFLQGHITAKYKDIVSKLGGPTTGDGYKVDAEWVVSDGATIATLYNYKDGINYCGPCEGTPVYNITDWHIGGHSRDAVDLIQQVMAGDVKVKPEAIYEIIVDNIGSVYRGPLKRIALEDYKHYVGLSEAGVSRAAGEAVYALKDGEHWMEHIPEEVSQ